LVVALFNMSFKRPEEVGVSPAAFYDAKEAKKYHANSRITHIQEELTNRAIELLALPTGKSGYILDIGCGSGLSGQALEKAGHYWVGCDVSEDMLRQAVQSKEDMSDADTDDEEEDDMEDNVGPKQHSDDAKYGNSAAGMQEMEDMMEDESDEEENPNKQPRFPQLKQLKPVDPGDGGDVLQADMGQGLPFRPGSFDGVISISALQWLCYASTSDQDPKLRLNRFFSALYSVLKRDAKAVLQFYPENAEQAVLIAQAASRVGFAGGVLVDYPNSTKAKKYFLCLSFERTYTMPTARGTESAEQGGRAGVSVIARQRDQKKRHVKSGKAEKKGVEWITKKKELYKRRGKEVKTDSKFTGRKRSRGF
jgi:18S rRNA (guanine1575-N7)-methyltransferase